MSQSSSQRCPACWTAFDGQPSSCPACGGKLGRRQRAPRLVLLLLGLVAGAAVVVVSLWEERAPTQLQQASDPVPPEETTPDVPPPPAPKPEPSGAVWRLAPESRRDAPINGLLLAAPPAAEPRGYLFLPLQGFPVLGGLRKADGSELDFTVVNWSLAQGYALLGLREAPPRGLAPAIPRASSNLPEQLHVPGDSEPMPVTRSPDGSLTLGRETPAGAGLFDAAGRAVGLSLGGTRALPVDPAIQWLGHPGSGPELGSLQQRLRASDPRLVMEDVREVLAAPNRESLALVLDLLDEVISSTGVRDTLLELEDLRATTAQAYVRELSDSSDALNIARTQLRRHPSHPGLIRETLLLLLSNRARIGGRGLHDPEEILELYDLLVMLSPERASDLAELTATRLGEIARQRLRERRYQEAITLAAAALGRFQGRADLYMIHAEALWDAGRRQEALVPAQYASQLDPAHLPQLSRWQAAVARDLDPDTVVIPYDPARNIITTRIVIDGQPVEFLIDTGASLTTIPSAIAQGLGLVKPDSPVINVDTANGRIEARRVRVANLQVGSISLAGVDVVVLDLPGELQGKGLLGLNVLQPLNMSIDSANRVLILKRPARGRRGR